MSSRAVEFQYSNQDRGDSPLSLSQSDEDAFWIFLGLRLEDYSSSDQAEKYGFKRLDNITFIRIETNSVAIDLNSSIEHMSSLFITSYLISCELNEDINFEMPGVIEKNFVRNSIVGPINRHRRRRDVIQIDQNEDFFQHVRTLIMVESMEPSVLVLQK